MARIRATPLALGATAAAAGTLLTICSTGCGSVPGQWRNVGTPHDADAGTELVNVGTEISPDVRGEPFAALASQTCAPAQRIESVQDQRRTWRDRSLGTQVAWGAVTVVGVSSIFGAIAEGDNAANSQSPPAGTVVLTGALITVGVVATVATIIAHAGNTPAAFTTYQHEEARGDVLGEHRVWLSTPRSNCPASANTRADVPSVPVTYTFFRAGKDSPFFSWSSPDLGAARVRAQRVASWCGGGTVRVGFGHSDEAEQFGPPAAPEKGVYLTGTTFFTVAAPPAPPSTLQATRAVDPEISAFTRACCVEREVVVESENCEEMCAAAGRLSGCVGAARSCERKAARSEFAREGKARCSDLFDDCLVGHSTKRDRFDKCVAVCERRVAENVCR